MSMSGEPSSLPPLTFTRIPRPPNKVNVTGREGRRFPYTSLKSATEIRLLEIQPGETSDPIQCRLRHAASPAAAPYEALSYTWGPPAPTRLIEINNQSFAVGKNLYMALVHLRLRVAPRTIWADAVCINQRNIRERNKQVLRISHIYEIAAQVVIWLGEVYKLPFTPESYELPSSSLEPVFSVESLTPLVKAALKIRPYEKASNLYRDFAEGKNLDENWCTFSWLLESDWWNRTWIVQELAVARFAVFIYGWSTLPCDVIYDLIDRLHAIFETHANGHEFRDMWQKLVLAHNLKMIQGLYRGGGTRDLHRLLRYTSSLEASDCRDKVFALLGLWQNQSDFNIQADYNLSATDVYVRAAYQNIMATKTLKIINTEPHDRRPHHLGDRVSHHLPSWVPDWSQKNAYRKDFNGWSYQHAPYTPDVFTISLQSDEEYAQQMHPFTAGLRTELSATFSDDLRALSLKGLMLSEVNGSWWVEANDPWSTRMHWGYVIVDQLRQNGFTFYGSEEATIEAFMCSVIGGGDMRSGHRISWETLVDLDQVLVQVALKNAMPKERFRVVGPWEPENVPNGERKNKAKDVAVVVKDWGRHLKADGIRRPPLVPSQESRETREEATDRLGEDLTGFMIDPNLMGNDGKQSKPPVYPFKATGSILTTVNGSVGHAPNGVEVGDKIFIPFGSDMPLLIRRAHAQTTFSQHRHTYELVGKCYVHGVMDGEMMMKGMQGGRTDSTFNTCEICLI